MNRMVPGSVEKEDACPRPEHGRCQLATVRSVWGIESIVQSIERAYAFRSFQTMGEGNALTYDDWILGEEQRSLFEQIDVLEEASILAMCDGCWLEVIALEGELTHLYSKVEALD